VLPFDYLTSFCDSYAFDATTTVSNAACTVCKNKYIPHTFVNLAICVKTTQLTLKGITALLNCVKYSGTTYACLECATGYFYDTVTLACITSCAAGQVRILDNLNGSINNCYAAADIASLTAGAAILARTSLYNTFTAGLATFAMADYAVVGPASTHVMSYDLAQAFEFTVSIPFDGAATSLGYRPSQMAAYYNKYVPLSTGTAGFAAVSDCVLYNDDGATYKCLRCSFGKAILVTYNAGGNVITCPSMSECKTDSFVSTIASCYACQTGGQYITFKLQLDVGNTFYSKLYMGATVLVTAVNPVYCAASTTVPNCIVYYDQYTSAGSLGPQNNCLACAPNYVPTYDVTITAKVTACVAITGASTTNTYIANKALSCSAVVAGTVTTYYAFSDETRTACLASTTANCYIVDGSQNCVICNSGYYLNDDGNCDVLSAPSCVSNTFSNDFLATVVGSDALSFVDVRKYYDLSVNLPMRGCSSCSSGYSRVIAPSTGTTMCIYSPYIASSPTLTYGSTYFVPNCLKYL
jgi:hypothetical protein